VFNAPFWFCRAIVFLCHGVAEHCQAYENVAAALTKEGMLVFAHDHG